MVASEITPKEDIDVCIAGCIKSVRAGGGSGDIFTNRDLFVMHCDNLRYIVLQICITPDPGELAATQVSRLIIPPTYVEIHLDSLCQIWGKSQSA